MPETFQNIFKTILQKQDIEGSSYHIEKGIGNDVFVGISPEGHPSILLMLKEDLSEDYNPIALNGIKTEFGIPCNYNFKKQEPKEAIFNIVSCTDSNTNLQHFFFDFFEKFFTREKNVSTKQLKDEIDFIRELFSHQKKPGREAIMGLWSELFIINKAEDTETWINKWPEKTRTTFDFSFGHIGLDVKSFGGHERKHYFKFEQLTNKSVEQTLILSTCCKEDESGESLFDLFDQISKKTNNNELITKLYKKISRITGPNIIDLMRFNSNIANSELRILEGSSIPTIKIGSFPRSVSNVSFQSDCSDLSMLDFSKENQDQIIKGVLTFPKSK